MSLFGVILTLICNHYIANSQTKTETVEIVSEERALAQQDWLQAVNCSAYPDPAQAPQAASFLRSKFQVPSSNSIRNAEATVVAVPSLCDCELRKFGLMSVVLETLDGCQRSSIYTTDTSQPPKAKAQAPKDPMWSWEVWPTEDPGLVAYQQRKPSRSASRRAKAREKKARKDSKGPQKERSTAMQPFGGPAKPESGSFASTSPSPFKQAYTAAPSAPSAATPWLSESKQTVDTAAEASNFGLVQLRSFLPPDSTC